MVEWLRRVRHSTFQPFNLSPLNLMTHYLDAAIEAARTAGELLRHHFQRPLRVTSSEAHDIKLEIDVRAQELITESLLKKFPEHALHGEEGVVGKEGSHFQWVVDPLDG